MKYVVLIMDGAAGYPIPERGGKTSLELAKTPNLDALAKEGTLGLARTVPPGMEASSACACMSVLGYDPEIYYKGRAGIEARSMGIPIGDGEVVFRCNLVAVKDGRMWSYSSGYIGTGEAHSLIDTLNKTLGSDEVQFYPGVSYRHICKIRGHEETLRAECTSPHDIPGKEIGEFLPRGQGSEILRDLMARSEAVLTNHAVNRERVARGDIPATMLWLFWGSSRLPDMPSFQGRYGLRAAMTSGVDLLNGLAQLAGMVVLEIPGVADNQDNDYAAQAKGAIAALSAHDLVVVHIEAPDEASHDRAIDAKIDAIQKIDGEVVSRLRSFPGDIRLLVMPDHPTPITLQTHTDDPVPFLLWGKGVTPNGAGRFTEAEAKGTGLSLEKGYKIMERFVQKADG
ncbi:MAG: cofactor-independent phosphoglycerate mutase [Dehalococcoidia bacterium]|nr:cofactor-independent phosphoglycerate mutase [Dehalococcoidia bacterium]